MCKMLFVELPILSANKEKFTFEVHKIIGWCRGRDVIEKYNYVELHYQYGNEVKVFRLDCSYKYFIKKLGEAFSYGEQN